MNGMEILQVIMWVLVCSGLGVGAYFLADKMQKRWWAEVLKPFQKSTVADVEELRLKDKAEARAAYERVVLAKLEVMKTAITMGYDDAELKALDQRLEGLIGADKVAGLVDPIATQVLPTADLLDADLQHETLKIREMRQQQSLK
jgi:hypothetical protein